MPRRPKIPRCHVCHRRALRYLDSRQRYLCDSCGKVFDEVVVSRHNPGLIEPQMSLRMD
jgi:transposase-like protein